MADHCTCYDNIPPVKLELSFEQAMAVQLAIQALPVAMDVRLSRSKDQYCVSRAAARAFGIVYRSAFTLMEQGNMVAATEAGADGEELMRRVMDYSNTLNTRASAVFMDIGEYLAGAMAGLPYCEFCRATGAPEHRPVERVQPDVSIMPDEASYAAEVERMERRLRGAEEDETPDV